MASALINSKTESVRISSILTVKQVDQGTLYSSIIAGTTLLPPNSIIKLVTTGGVGTLKITGDVEQTWATASPLGQSVASASAVAGITTIATADPVDAATTQAMAILLKAKLNSLITALKA